MLTREQAVEHILTSGGRFLSLCFVKRGDGSERRMVCRVGVHKGTTGAGPAYDWVEKRLIPVYDVQAARRGEKGFRAVCEEGITRIKINGQWEDVQ